MPTLEAYTASRQRDWDGFVARNPSAGYGHLSAHLALGGASHHTAMLYDRGEVIAILPLFETSSRRLRAVRLRGLVSGAHFPAGPLCAPGCSDKTRAGLFRQLLAHVNRVAGARRADYVRIAYPNVIDARPAIADFGCQPLRDHGFADANIVTRLLPLRDDPAALRRQLRERGRRWLRKSEAAGVQVAVITDESAWRACYPLNLWTLGALAWSPEAFDMIWTRFIRAGHATAFAASLEGETVSVVVIVHLNATAYYWIGWNSARGHAVGANYAALWTAILEAQRRGAGWFELGSDDTGTPKARNIAYFKAAFGGERYYSLVGVLDRAPVKSSVLTALEAGLAALRSWRDCGLTQGDADGND